VNPKNWTDKKYEEKEDIVGVPTTTTKKKY